MQLTSLPDLPSKTFPANRTTRNLVGGSSPIHAQHFAAGHVTLHPANPAQQKPPGQIPWHNHPNEEIYFILEGTAQAAVGSEIQTLHAGQTLFIPPNTFHQLTNLSPNPVLLIYIYAPNTPVAHWKQELENTLPKPSDPNIPSLPPGAHPQHNPRLSKHTPRAKPPASNHLNI